MKKSNDFKIFIKFFIKFSDLSLIRISIECLEACLLSNYPCNFACKALDPRLEASFGL